MEVISVEVYHALGFHPTLAIATITLTLGKTKHPQMRTKRTYFITKQKKKSFLNVT